MEAIPGANWDSAAGLAFILNPVSPLFPLTKVTKSMLQDFSALVHGAPVHAHLCTDPPIICAAASLVLRDLSHRASETPLGRRACVFRRRLSRVELHASAYHSLMEQHR